MNPMIADPKKGNQYEYPEADMDIWHDSVWVNRQQQIFFVPIWRNGNSEFMLLAEQFGYTLEKHFDLTGYTGYAFVRHPSKRLAGQIWRAMQNQTLVLNSVLIISCKANCLKILTLEHNKVFCKTMMLNI